MKAMLVSGEHLSWSDVEDPTVGDTDILIDIYAAAVNRADLLQRKGTYPSPKGCPPWMGLEVAGKVIGVGAQTKRYRIGDSVCALLGGGGYAERVAVPEGMVMPIPEGLSFEEAAALPEACATCYLNLFIEGRMQPGETVFFPAGASGLASIGIPMAKAFGAYVITSVLNDEKRDEIRRLGADVIINSSVEDTAEVLQKEAEGGHPVDLAIDCLGGATIGRALPCVAEGCRWILISTLDGITTEVPLRALLTRGIELKGSMLRKRTPAEKSDILTQLVEHVWTKVSAGEVMPTIYRVLPMAQAEEAHDLLTQGKNTGKVVLKIK